MSGGEATKQRKPIITLNKVRLVDKIFFLQNLSVLLRAGFSLAHALRTVSEQIKQKRFRKLVEDIIVSVESGETFTTALRRHEYDFGELFINMIDSGEVSGKLEITLQSLAEQLKKSHALLLKVRNALAYPLVITVAMLVVGTAMMVFVIPKIVELYRGSPKELPTVTKAVIWISDAFVNNGALVAVGFVLLIVVAVATYHHGPSRLLTDRLLLRLPIFGNVIREVNLARFSRVFYSLISTDIPIVKAFEIMAHTSSNAGYRTYLLAVIPELETGISIGQVLAGDDLLFPPTIIEMISVGEQSGALEEMTKELAEYFEQEAASTLDGLSVLIEPLLMLALGIGVGIIAVAVLLPMYQLVDVI